MSIYETVGECRICKGGYLDEILDLGDQPPANSLRADLAEQLPSVPLVLVRCADCGAVQLRETVDPAYLFEDYVWVTGTSRTAEDYSRIFFEEAIKRGGRSGFVAEVASNDGTFLRRFADGGFQVLGIDPAKNLARQATESGIRTIAAFFSEKVAEDVATEMGDADYVIARNVIPHVKDAQSVISGMATLLSDEGVGMIEFHYAKIILDELHYDSIYHEHLLYLTLRSLSKLLEGCGLHAFDVVCSPISGGSLVVYFSKKRRAPTDVWIDLLAHEEKKEVNSKARWKEFAAKSMKHAAALKDAVFAQKDRDGALLMGYGASARSSTLLNYTGIGSEHLVSVIDKNPLKQGRFTPGSDVRIIDFEAGLEELKRRNRSVLLLAWNFEEEIVADLVAGGVKTTVIVPLPNEPRIYEVP